MKETTADKVIRYLGKCKTPRTNEQIAKGSGCNINTVRRALGQLINAYRIDWLPKDGGKVYALTETERASQEWLASLEKAA